MAIGQAAAAAVLALVSLFLGWSAFKRYMLKSNFTAALKAYDTARVGIAEDALKSARGWREDFALARELQAKIKADGSGLETAETEYRWLADAAEYPHPEVAHYGLGVVALKKAEREKDAKKAEALLKQAREAFKQAKSANSAMAEADIGLAHCELLSTLRAGLDLAKVQAVLAAFEKAHTKSTSGEGARNVSREGLVDLYAGLGWVHYQMASRVADAGARAEHSRKASVYFRACHQCAPRWLLPKKNYVYVEAQRLAETDIPLAQLKEQEAANAVLRNELKMLFIRQQSVYGPLLEPWFQHYLAGAYAYGRKRDHATFFKLLNEPLALRRDLGARLEPALIEAVLAAELAFETTDDPKEKTRRLDHLWSVLKKVLDNEESKKPEAKAMRAAALHDRGCAEEHRGASQKKDAEYERAVASWKEALALEESYETLRNLAVVQKRRKGKADEAKEYLEKALKAAEGRPQEWVKTDAQNLRKHFEEAPK